MKIRIKTKDNVNYNQWLDQLSRFRRHEDKLTNHFFPSNSDRPGFAEIIVDIRQPIISGFNAKITYYQNYETEQVLEDSTIVYNLQRVQLLDYNLIIPYDECNILLSVTEGLIDQLLTGLDKLRAQILKAIMLDITSKNTFGGLLEEDYIIEIL